MPGMDGIRRVSVIGIGCGDPSHLTLEAVEALAGLDLVLIPDKGEEKQELRAVREAICARFATMPGFRSVGFNVPPRRAGEDYDADVAEWHERLAAIYAEALRRELPAGGTAGLLVWGDPCLYDSTLRILDRVIAGGLALELRVIPGITSFQVLAARHAIALHDIGEPVTIMPARRLGDTLPDDLASVVVMLDGTQRFASIYDADLEIFWGASLGLPGEELLAGPLAEVKHDLLRRRAAARAGRGWLMDTYLLRRRKRQGGPG